ncbi:DJ-1/PfpI family protein [Candidatus Woesearchaeota archaeon]|nr:DJ-1/PfpI family protein [Candidatus Woesearchaeota archaeon]
MRGVKASLFLCMLIIFSGCTIPENEVEKMPDVKGKSVLMIIAAEGFRDEEFLEPKAVFEKSGLSVTVSSKGVDTAKGALGAEAKIDKDITAVTVNEYDAVVFIGGPGAAAYFEDELALGIAKEAYEQGKVVAAICIAPSILANAGILSGKRATCFSSESSNLEAQGAEYTGAEVEADGHIITANGPAAAKKFGERIVKAIGG